MYIFVGSKNPVKINATTVAAVETWPKVKVIGYDVDSEVSEQPMTDQETKQGAANRARAALDLGLTKYMNSDQALGVGLEGGVLINEHDEMWATVWGAVVDQQDEVFLANGARFLVPDLIADPIRRGGEMGPIISQYFEGRSVKHQEGLIGVITNKFVDRTEIYTGVIKIALGRWYGRNWEAQLPTT